jgi:thioredoxin-like negative regulator of GroEL
MKEQKYTYGLLLNADEVAGKYGVSGIPTIYVIGRDGKVVYQSVGFEGEEALEAAVKKALGL